MDTHPHPTSVAPPSASKIDSAISSFIDGEFVPARSDAKVLDVVNPATGAVVAQLYEADAQEVDRAVQAAARSFERGTWHRLPVERRTAVPRRVCELVERDADELCHLETIDLGIPTSQAKGMVTSRVIRNFRFYADSLAHAAERAVRLDDDYQRYVYREPVGVCALISPWNAPLMLATSKIAPALAFGNSCVVKTSEYTPLALARFMTLLREAGVPPGVVNLVNGRGDVTGASLVAHPRVELVSFTGGGTAGSAIAGVAGRAFKKCDLELGGKSAVIVSDSADFEQALDSALLGCFGNSGQMCFAGSRILVQRSIASRFTEAFVARAEAIRVGDPLDPLIEMGPLAFDTHYRRVLSYCRPVPQEGVELLAGGKPVAGLDSGYFMTPAVLRARCSSARVCQEEIFGPVATLLVYDSFDEAIAIANDSAFGLAGYVWSNRLDETTAAANRMRTGTVMVNSSMVFDLRMPFGGYKASGIGREGIESLRNFYSEEKTVAVAQRALEIPIRLGASR